ncbi:MAG: hypothetical protein ACX930_05665 [Erythrobacter sp.]
METMKIRSNAQTMPLQWSLLALGAISGLWYSLCLAKIGVIGTDLAIYSGWTRTFVASSLWGGLTGSLLVTLGSRWAVQAFTVSLVGLLAASVNLFIVPDVPANLYAMPLLLGMWLITLPAFYYASRLVSTSAASAAVLDPEQFEVAE